jgi:hypothetical protein
LDKCPLAFKPVFYQRYVDDTFLLFRSKSNVDQFFNYMNNQHPCIRFTKEVESNNRISFLDVCVTRHNHSFLTSVHRKPTFTGLGLSFFSFCTKRFKINCIKTLLHRAYNICSNYSLLHKEFQFLRNFFICNGFLPNLFDSQLGKFLDTKFINNNQLPSTTTADKTMYVTLPYFGFKSEKMKLELYKLCQKFFPSTKFVIILINKFTLGSLFHYKDRLRLLFEALWYINIVVDAVHLCILVPLYAHCPTEFRSTRD